MADHGLIAAYQRALLARLPAQPAQEVCDGLADAYEQYVRRGLSPDQAASAAVREFGSPDTVVDAFCRACPVWRLARVLIVTGPIVGGCWAAALTAGRAWDWPIPVGAPVLIGLILATSVGLLVTAALSRRYQILRRAGIAGSVGVAVLDGSVILTAIWLAPVLGWLLVVAACASISRITLVTVTLRKFAAEPLA